MDTLYRWIVKPVLFSFSPDYVHRVFICIGERAGSVAVGRVLLAAFYQYRGRGASKIVDGIRYRTPVVLAAGFDPDGRLTRILPSLGFGGEEIGSITAQPCEGNPPPQAIRLVRNKSIIVRKGLKNRGVDALIEHLTRTPREKDFVIGISIARTNNKEAATDAESGIHDIVTSFKKLIEANVGDYYTFNISCPNAFTGESFIDPENLRQLLPRIREVPCTKPIYLKMPITIPWEQFDSLLYIAAQNDIQGVVIGNLNKEYTELTYPKEAPIEFRGGLSGRPTQKRSNELIRKTREAYGKRFTIIGVGGILSPEDAMEKFRAGADLVELITGMIFEGPGLIKRICAEYTKEFGHDTVVS